MSVCLGEHASCVCACVPVRMSLRVHASACEGECVFGCLRHMWAFMPVSWRACVCVHMSAQARESRYLHESHLALEVGRAAYICGVHMGWLGLSRDVQSTQ